MPKVHRYRGAAPAPRLVPNRSFGDVAISASLLILSLLVAQHFNIVELPGTVLKPGAFGYQWSRVPLVFILFISASGIFASWLLVRFTGVTFPFRLLVQIHGLLSGLHITTLTLTGILCPYSLTSFMCFVAFWLVVRSAFRSPRVDYATPVAALAGTALVSSFLYMGTIEVRRGATKPRQADKHQTGKQLQNLTANKQETAEESRPQQTAPQPNDGARLELGSPNGAMQVVAYIDYQSSHTKRLDASLASLTKTYGEKLSVKVRHFPICKECNLSVEKNTNPEACRLAKSVEAAQTLGGTKAAIAMHRWILQQPSPASDKKLTKHLAAIGIGDKDEFFKTRDGSQTLSVVMSDIIEGRSIGVTKSPTIFVNGTRLPGRFPELVLRRHLKQLALKATHETPATTNSNGQEVTTNADATTETEHFPKAVQWKAIEATVRVQNDVDQSTGSGVIFASKGPFVFVLTADHVVGTSKWVKVELFDADTYPQASRAITASVVAKSKEDDLAVLRFASQQKPTTITLAETVHTDAEHVLSVGCSHETPPTSVANQITGSSLVKRDKTSKPTRMWQVEKESVTGRSGGPLLDRNGNLIGIASGISEGKSYFCHLETIQRFLKETGLHLTAK